MIEEYGREIDGVKEIYLEQGIHPFKVAYYADRPANYMRFEYTGSDGIRKPVTNSSFYQK